MFRRSTAAGLIFLVLAAGVSASCGDGDDQSPAEGTAETSGGSKEADAGDVERYCAITKELDRAGSEFFKELEQDPSATAKDYQEAEADFIEEYEAELNELASEAPPEIQEDLRVLLAALKGRAGLGPAVDKEEALEAQANIQKFEKAEC